jgi:hypothetical protein
MQSPLCFQMKFHYIAQVPNVFRKMFPMSSHFTPLNFAQSWVFITYVGGQKGSAYVIIFWKCTLLFGRVFKVAIFWGDGPIKAIHTDIYITLRDAPHN